MSYNFKCLLILLIVVVSSTAIAQENEKLDSRDSTLTLRRNVTDLYLQNGSPVGDNYAGNGLNGGIGIGFRTQWYVVNGLYLGGALSNDYMKVADVNVIGNYDTATKFNAYLYAGYDYKFADLWHITADVGIGYSQNKNRQSGIQGNGKFRDSGTLVRFTSSVEFEVNPSFSIFMSPSFEMVDYKIRTAPSLSDQFSNGNYFNIAIGARFTANRTNTKRMQKYIDKVEAIPAEDRNVRERVRLKQYKRRLARRAQGN